jgi:hypothetical protein
MSEKIKLSEAELKILRGYNKTQNDITFDLGQVDIQKAFLEGQRASILDGLADLQEKSNKTAKELQEKYGEGNINLETGEFIIPELFFEFLFNIYNKTIIKIIK